MIDLKINGMSIGDPSALLPFFFRFDLHVSGLLVTISMPETNRVTGRRVLPEVIHGGEQKEPSPG